MPAVRCSATGCGFSPASRITSSRMPSPGVYPPEQPTNYWHKGQGKVTWQVTPTLRVSQLLRLEWWGGYGGPSRTTIVRSRHQDPRGAHPHLRDRGERRRSGMRPSCRFVPAACGNPICVTGPLTGDYVTPNHTDNLTGLSTRGAQQIGRTVVRRDQQAVKIERYMSRSSMTHTLRGPGFSSKKSTTSGRRPGRATSSTTISAARPTTRCSGTLRRRARTTRRRASGARTS